MKRPLYMSIWNTRASCRCACRIVVESLNSPFFSPHIGVEPWRAKRGVVQDNLHAHAQNAAMFSPESGEKPYLEVLSRFGL